MSKNPDLVIVILFSIIWLVHPISYDGMRSRHSISQQENIVNDEFEFLESNIQKIILAKDTNRSLFTEGFTPPFPRRQSFTGSQTVTGLSGSNSGQG